MYVTTYNTSFLSELPISTFYGKQFYQKQVRKRNTIPNLRIAEHICGRNWWLPVWQYRDWSAKQKTYHLLRFYKFQQICTTSVSVLNIKNLSICCRHKYNQSISRISEHICGRKWWLSVRQYCDQRHQKRFTGQVGSSLWPLPSARSNQPSKKVSKKIVKWLNHELHVVIWREKLCAHCDYFLPWWWVEFDVELLDTLAEINQILLIIYFIHILLTFMYLKVS